MNNKTKERVEGLANKFGEDLAAIAKTEQEFYEMLKYAIKFFEENCGEVA